MQLAGDLVADADAEPVERVEHVQLRHGEIGEAVHSCRIPHDERVEPAAPSWPSGRRAVLVAELAHFGLERLLELRRQRAVADARRVRLHDAEHAVERVRPDADADRRAPRRRVARRHVRIRPVVDVEKRSLCTLEQHGGAGVHRTVHGEAHVVGQRQQALTEPRQQREHRVHVHGRVGAAARQHAPRMLGALLHHVAQPLGMVEVEHAHAAPADLVLVRRPDAAPRRADRLARCARAVHCLVIRQHEVRALAHVQPALDVHPRLHETVDLVEQRVRIEHDAVADRAAHAWMKNPARDLVQHEGAVAEVDGVARVRTSLIPHDPVGTLGEHVHQLPLPLVPPLRADDDHDARFRTEHDAPERRFPTCEHTKRPAGRGALFESRPGGGRVNREPGLARSSCRAKSRNPARPGLKSYGRLPFGSFARACPVAFHSLIMSNCIRCAFWAAARSPELAASDSFCISA